MLNIDQLRYNLDKPFLDLMEGVKRRVNRGGILWYKGQKRYFEQYNNRGVIYCHYKNLWCFIQDSYELYGFKRMDIEIKINYLLKRYYNIKILRVNYLSSLH